MSQCLNAPWRMLRRPQPGPVHRSAAVLLVHMENRLSRHTMFAAGTLCLGCIGGHGDCNRRLRANSPRAHAPPHDRHWPQLRMRQTALAKLQPGYESYHDRLRTIASYLLWAYSIRSGVRPVHHNTPTVPYSASPGCLRCYCKAHPHYGRIGTYSGPSWWQSPWLRWIIYRFAELVPQLLLPPSALKGC